MQFSLRSARAAGLGSRARRTLCAFVTVALAAMCIPQSGFSKQPTVTVPTTSGLVRGQFSDDGSIEIFRGIPYAAQGELFSWPISVIERCSERAKRGSPLHQLVAEIGSVRLGNLTHLAVDVPRLRRSHLGQPLRHGALRRTGQVFALPSRIDATDL